MSKIQTYLDIVNRSEYREVFEEFKNKIFRHTLRWEGGGKLHKVKGDSGGWTIWGVAYNKNKSLFKNLADFKDTTYTEAAAIAFVKYYMSAHAHLMPVSARLMYFDMAYNMGVRRAIKIAQRCAGVTADGIVGPITKRAFINVTEDCLYQRRVGFYNYLVRKNNDLKRFIKGWINRTNDIRNS